MSMIRKTVIALLSAIVLIAFSPSLRVSAADDYTGLQDARDQVAAAIAAEAGYNADSFLAFEADLDDLGGLAAVDAMLSDPFAEQSAVDALEADLRQLLSQLVTKATWDAVSDAYIVARARNVTAYTVRSRADYTAILDAVRNVIQNERAGETLTSAQTAIILGAVDVLVPLADKTDLLQAIAEADAIDGSDGSIYIPSTFAAFQAAYDAFATEILAGVAMTVDEIVGNADASVDEAATALSAVEAALTLLALRPDKTSLIADYGIAVEYDLTPYTPSTAPLFTAGLVQVKTVIDDPEADVAEVAAATTALSSLYDLLVLRADKSALVLANNAAIVAYYEERESYTTSSHALFREAVLAYGTYLAVNAAIADADASQAETDALLTQVQDALALLVPRADVDALDAAYRTAAALDLSPFTPASAALYETTLADVLAVILDKDTDQSEADAALVLLDGLSSLLTERADKTVLAAAIADGASMRAAVYSNSSFQILVRRIDAADAIMDDADAAQTAVDDAATAIRAAIAGLSLKSRELVIRAETESISLLDHVTLGDATVAGYAIGDPTILAIDDDGNASGLKFGSTTVIVTLTNGITEELTVVVKAKIQTGTMVFAIVLPAVAVGGAFAMLFWNQRTLAFLKGARIFRRKPKS